MTVGSANALTVLLSAETGAAVLPATFVSATVKAANLAAAGELATGAGEGIVSANVSALTKGALQAMFIAKVRATGDGPRGGHGGQTPFPTLCDRGSLPPRARD